MHGSLVYCCRTQLVNEKCHLPDVQFRMVFIDLVTYDSTVEPLKVLNEYGILVEYCGVTKSLQYEGIVLKDHYYNALNL